MYSGAPYLVMELLEGKPIHEYCREWQLGVKEILELFMRVCEAVQHAHAALVVHRDLKPSNIMVTTDGTPKLLDFGIAKLVEREAESTWTSAALMTPDYASPEQVRGEVITVASDVYSLGMVLYELLSGSRPYRLKNYSPAEIQQQVCTGQPPPSEANVASARLRRQLEGDLDNILMMALRKEPQRRYGSVAQFADDLRRHFDGETAIARPDTFTYRTSKFVKRNQLSLGLGVSLVVAIAAGGYWNVKEGIRAQRRFGEVRSLANSLLTEIDPIAASIPGTTEMRKAMLDKSLLYLDGLTREAGDDVELVKELARAYHRVADIQGLPNTANLGQRDAALESHAKAIEMEQRLLPSRPKDEELLKSLAIGYANIALIHAYRDHAGKSAAALANAMAYKQLLPDETFVALYLAEGKARSLSRDHNEAIKLFQAAIPAAEKIKARVLFYDLRKQIAEEQMRLGFGATAMDEFDKVLALVRKEPGSTSQRLALVLAPKGEFLTNDWTVSMERHCEAVGVLEEADQLWKRLLAGNRKRLNHFVSTVVGLQLLAIARGYCGKGDAVEAATNARNLYKEFGYPLNDQANYYVALANFLTRKTAAAKAILDSISKDFETVEDLRGRVALALNDKPAGLRHLAN